MIGYGLKSGADQRMLARELQLHKARSGAKNVILSLVLKWLTHLTLLNTVHQYIMPKARQQSSDDEEGDVEAPFHGAINEKEAEEHRCKLDKTIDDLKKSTTEQEI